MPAGDIDPDSPMIGRGAFAVAVVNALPYKEAVAGGRVVGLADAEAFARHHAEGDPSALSADWLRDYPVVLTAAKERRRLVRGVPRMPTPRLSWRRG